MEDEWEDDTIQDFTTISSGWGELRFGHPKSTTREEATWRERSATYLTQTILSCPSLRARQLDDSDILFPRLRSHAQCSLVGSLLAVLGCTYADLKQRTIEDPATTELLHRLMKETYEVDRLFLPKLTFEKFAEWIERRLSGAIDRQVDHQVVRLSDP
jgi:hypothetical protein